MLRPRDVRAALEQMINDQMLPIARRYDYSPQSLNLRASWKPIVLIIGNYSSGKSSLINEIVGAPIQRTGQAPTDDCFTILTAPDDAPDTQGAIRVVEETPGSTIVNDESLPFSGFKSYGSRFVAHFLMKKVNSPRLKNLAIIDSPGMLDSVTELDRGYDYQEVVGRFAELADLVVLIFDPHRAGTIKETYVSIRSTLPRATSEDRVLFVMNRIDECRNLVDLLRCYGSLCWNLSQMTGRKDIPRVFLTYSPKLSQPNCEFHELAPERDELVDKIEQAPQLQVSHWLGIVDNHLHKLELIAKTLGNASMKYRSALVTYLQIAVAGTIGGAFALDSIVALLVGDFGRGSIGRLFKREFLDWPLLFLLLLMAGGALGFYGYFRRWRLPKFHRELMEKIDECAELDTRYAHDLWDSVRPSVLDLLKDPKNYSPFATHRANLTKIRKLIHADLKGLYEKHLGRQVEEAQAPAIP